MSGLIDRKAFDKELENVAVVASVKLATGKGPAMVNELILDFITQVRGWLKEAPAVEAAKPAAHWEHIIEQKPEFDAAGRFIGISETPKVRCSHCKETNKNYESPFCPHCGAPMTEEVAGNV